MSHFTKDEKPGGVEIRAFKPKSLTGGIVHEYSQVKEQFGSLAATDPSSNPHFALFPETKKNLGIDTEERSHLEDQVKQEVETRIKKMRDLARLEGFKEGIAEGRLAGEKEFSEEFRPKFDQFLGLLQEFENAKTDLYSANEVFLIQLVFQISRQILMGELKKDDAYVKRVMGKLIEKMGAKENIHIKISRDDYVNVESLKEFLKGNFPDLKNVQIVPSDELALGGVKIETDLSRINASVETQFHSIESALMGEGSSL